jgi:hypothetical protein
MQRRVMTVERGRSFVIGRVNLRVAGCWATAIECRQSLDALVDALVEAT